MEEYRKKQQEKWKSTQKPDTSEDQKIAEELQKKYEQEIMDEEFAKKLQEEFNTQEQQLQQAIDLTQEDDDVIEITPQHSSQEQQLLQEREQQLRAERQRLEIERMRQIQSQQQQNQMYHPFSSRNFSSLDDDFNFLNEEEEFQNFNQIHPFQNRYYQFQRIYPFGSSSIHFNPNSTHNQTRSPNNQNNNIGESYEDLLQLQERLGSVPKGAKKEDIENTTSQFKLRKLFKDQDTCVICYEEFKIGESVRKLPCLHLFHSNCIDEWLQQSRNCPLCKKDILGE
eukprot:gene12000-5400_t